ncbi:MmgE/PrpD family protein [Achromobacter aloeverae]
MDTTTTDYDATRWLSERALEMRFSALSVEARRIAIHCIADWYAATLPAIGMAPLRPLVEDVLSEGGKPLATAAGVPEKTSLYQAALVNGTTSHLLDYDDVNMAISGHPTAVVYSALLPLAEHRGSSGMELMDAFVAGYETACRVGRWLGDAHYERGYHATFSVGIVGVAAACAHLLKLDVEKTACALGLAATQAAGLKSQFGTMAKPLHAGLAARNGLMAARLAGKGFQGALAALESDQGYAQTLSPSPDWAAATAPPAQGWYLHDRLFKFHASCYGTHAAIDSARSISESGVAIEQIVSIEAVVNPRSRSMCNIAAPRTANEARFSLRLNIVFALLGFDTAAIDAYGEDRLQDPAVIALREKVEVRFSEDMQLMEAEVSVKTADGKTRVARVDAGIPEPSVDVEERRVRAKLSTLATPACGIDGAGQLARSIFALPDLKDVGALTHCLAGHSGLGGT